LQAHPDLFVKVDIANSTIVIDKVLKGEISLGIVDIQPKESELHTELIMNDGLIPIASPSLGIPEDVSLKDLLLEQTVIAHVDDHRIHRLAQEFFDKFSIPYSDARIPFETGSVQASITAVIHGLGIAWVPKSAVTSALQTGALVTFPCAEPIVIGYYLIHQDSRKLSPVEAHLKDLLTGNMK
jgi:DNA-binding transcriptional LysR family regulator